MTHSFYIAWRYVSGHPGKSAILVACISIILFLPMALQHAMNASQQQLQRRAAGTPMIIGARGSALDLVMNTLYFSHETPQPVTMSVVDRVQDSGLAFPVPMYVRFQAMKHPLVGTRLDYFDFRELRVGQGRMFATLGECVLGASVAAELNLGPGDSLISTPENLFDLASVYPLKMTVTGVLEPSYTADDQAVFTDLKTTWVIHGLGHGHEDLQNTGDASVILQKSDSGISANAKLTTYSEITAANLESFHFHGNISEYPLTSVIAWPVDAKSGTVLRGRFLGSAENEQIIRPQAVVKRLMADLFRVKQFMDVIVLVTSAGILLAVILVFALSLRLRDRELRTIFYLGCSRATVVSLLAAECVIILALSLLLCLLLGQIMTQMTDEIVRLLLVKN